LTSKGEPTVQDKIIVRRYRNIDKSLSSLTKRVFDRCVIATGAWNREFGKQPSVALRGLVQQRALKRPRWRTLGCDVRDLNDLGMLAELFDRIDADGFEKNLLGKPFVLDFPCNHAWKLKFLVRLSGDPVDLNNLGRTDLQAG